MKTNLSQEKLWKISDIICDNIGVLFEALEIENIYEGTRGWSGPCNVHGGDKSTGLLLYTEGHTHRGFWNCVTHKCHDVFKPTIIGFTRGVLSHKKHSWKQKGDKFESFDDTLKFIFDAYKINPDNITVDLQEIEKRKFLAETRWAVPMAKNKPLMMRKDVRGRLGKTPTYFIKRGFSADILDKYDVGYCDNPKKEMYQRCVVPIYDEGYNYLVGCQGRSIFDKCSQCKGYHDPNGKCRDIPKWKNSDHFNKKQHLFNYWFAKEHIKRSKTVILVESIGNVWRLEESEIHNAVALFGTDFSDTQQFLIEKVGCMNIIVILDSGEAGRIGTQKIVEQTKNFYNVKPVYLDTGDIADLSVEEIRRNIIPMVER